MADTDIAVVGMACRLPGAADLDAFWKLLREGRDARRELSDEHLRSLGVPPEVLADPDYVKAAMVLDGVDQFDAPFFGFSPRDAALFDPQHRVWLEVCWEAFEHAGHPPERFTGRVGVFAGCGMDTYLLHNILTNPDLVRQVGMFLIRHTGNDKDFLATRTSYQFDLRGPSVNVLTACSTSLVAIHQAAQSLLAGECDMALAGGVTILVPQDRGYLFKDGEVLSPDGHCRTFDADSKGTIFGSGAGVVVLRRLADALADGDTIHAVVAGSAVNNDGARKVSYLAPSVDGYAEVVAEALALADIPAENVQYVEAHGTGTSVGDPIEIEALTQAFRATTSKSGYCGIGSVKTNIGHLDTAAGVAGLIKLVLAMQHGEIPPSRNFKRPNPLIDFPKSPFHVVSELRPWPRRTDVERIGGVSSLGVGGTNAHVLVREPLAQPDAPAKVYPRRCHLVPVSGKGEAAATANARALGAWLQERAANATSAANVTGATNATGAANATTATNGAANGAAGAGAAGAPDLADVAWTTQVGRRAFAHRGFAVGADAAGLAAQLAAPTFTAQLKKAPERAPSVVFLFSGGGAQHPGMARGLYEHEPAFRAAADECLRALPEPTRGAVHALLFGADATAANAERMERPSLLLPTLFLVEYSLARTLESFGVVPDAMIGHSLGEYVAATLGGTWSLAQVLPALVLRGECLEQSPAGAVLSVSLSAAEVQALGDPELSLSAANAPNLSAVAGSPAAIARLEQQLQQRGVDYQRLRIGVAAHSHLLDPVLDRFRAGLRRFQLQPAQKPWVSNVTGEWIDPQRAADPDYWVEHLRRTVRFQDGIAALLAGGDRVFVEIGPGKALASLVRMHERAAKSPALVSLPHPKDDKPADSFMLEALGRLWQLGVPIDWQAFHGGVARRRVPLPTYRFQRQRHWIEPGAVLAQEGVLRGSNEPSAPTRLPESEWLRQPTWRAQELPAGVHAGAANWLVVGGGAAATALARELRVGGGRAFVLQHGAAESRAGDELTLPLLDSAAIERALQTLAAAGAAPQRLLFAWGLEQDDPVQLVHAGVALWQALGRTESTAGLRALGLTRQAVRTGTEAVQRWGQGAVSGLLRVVPREFPGVRTRSLDVDAAALAEPATLARAVAREAEADDGPLAVALRNGARFVQELGPVVVPADAPSPWREGATWLVTGGLGGIGMVVASHLAKTAKANLVLLGRRGLPPRAAWDEWLALRGGDAVARSIQQVLDLERAGGAVEVLAADVTDADAMTRAVRAATARFGPLHGVVHAAGVLDDAPLLLRQAARGERVLAPKVRGAAVLDQVTADAPPGTFVLFASTSGLAGIPGQCDYAAANAALDTFAQWRSTARPGRTLAVDWGLWTDAGMLAGATTVAVPTPAWLGARNERDGAVVFASTWSPATHWQLADHRIRGGDCVMPGTGHLELMTAAAQAVAGTAQVELHGVELLTPLAFPGDEPRQVIVEVGRQRDGLDVVVASAPVGDAAPHARTTHARARARTHDGAGAASLDAALRDAATKDVGRSNDQDRRVAFGPRWQVIERVREGAGVVLGDLRLPEQFASDVEQHRLHAGMLDMAFGCGIRLLSDGCDALFVPVACERVVVHGRMPARVVTLVQRRAWDERTRLGTLDVTVASPAGVVLVELRGLQLFGVRGAFAAAAETTSRNGAHSPPARAGTPEAAASAAPVSRLRTILPRGITGPEGMAGLARALASGAPQVVVASMDPVRVADWLALPPEQPRAALTAHAAPAAGAAASDGPRDDVERKLADAYRELLGVEQPGLDQDFFELGGHSLLAVRLFARIHKEFALDLELATLLSAGTVRGLAAAVRTELKLPEPGSEPVRSVAARKGQHVVPIQTAGTRPKLFLVHGAGGNVLGFRDLAHYFGKDQPVYGLQARGVDGKQPPHTTIAEMAAAYAAEVREVQPHGPYCFGGYSGGGVVAYEMAQLLRAAGEEVAFVGMIDSWCPQIPQRSKVVRTFLHLGRLARRGPMYPFRILKMKLDRWTAARTNDKAREQGGVMPQDLRGFEVQFAFERAFESHRVGPYDGPVWLFRAQEQNQSTRYVFDDDLGWRPFARGLRIAHCPGNHYTMCTEPNVQVLCKAMMDGLDEALAAVAPAVG